MKKRKFSSKLELLLLLVAVLVLVGWWLYSTREPAVEGVAEIYLGKEKIATLPLDKDTDFIPLEKPEVTFQVRGGKAAFVRSDCPDQICVDSGFLGHGGQTAACLPNDLLLKIVSTDSAVDMAA